MSGHCAAACSATPARLATSEGSSAEHRPHAIAEKARIVVRAVDAGEDSARFEESVDAGASHVEEGTDHAVLAHWTDAAHRAEACAGDEAHQRWFRPDRFADAPWR